MQILFAARRLHFRQVHLNMDSVVGCKEGKGYILE